MRAATLLKTTSMIGLAMMLTAAGPRGCGGDDLFGVGGPDSEECIELCGTEPEAGDQECLDAGGSEEGCLQRAIGAYEFCVAENCGRDGEGCGERRRHHDDDDGDCDRVRSCDEDDDDDDDEVDGEESEDGEDEASSCEEVAAEAAEQCVAGGGAEEDCAARSAAFLEICEGASEEEPAEEASYNELCEQAATAVVAQCVEAGGDEDDCQARGADFLERCLCGGDAVGTFIQFTRFTMNV